MVSELTSDAVIGFAKQGHPQAIAVLLNRALVPKGAHVKVRQKQELLKVLINFLRETDLELLVDRVHESLNDLSPQNIERVQIFTQRLGDRQASFRKEIVTQNSPPSEGSPAETETPNALDFGQAKVPRLIKTSPNLIAKNSSSKETHPGSLSAPDTRYSVAEFLSQVSSVEELNVLDEHPFFTGVCPSCHHGYSGLENPPLFWDCQACGWQDDLSQKIPQKTLRETPQRRKITQGKRLGSYLIEAGLLSPAQIEVALADQQLNGIRLGEVLVRRGWIKEETVEYFMRKVIEPDRNASTGQAEAYLESSRNLLKTLSHQNKSVQEPQVSSPTLSTENMTVRHPHDSELGRTHDSKTDTQGKFNEKETLILSNVDLPPVTAQEKANAVNERETLLLLDVDLDQLIDDPDH